MKIEFEARKSFKWLDILQPFVAQYNEADTHRSIGMTPSDVDKTNENQILQKFNKLKSKIPIRKPKLKVGDRVRITVKKEAFANKYKSNWTREIFTVSKVIATRPVIYRITDAQGEEIEGSFYEKELQKTVL
ncbi:uncharacterized protein LOC124365443 [Homalodisca vitripennis]|uniref:uncharacterized protein LOC124365443 n=1 Tax=Homalodisca vitripennis TaxID=197043 RepID=UPI001EEA4645|nr:uncharacterized protein LOC124365443 [Homalodisca vitripennis]